MDTWATASEIAGAIATGKTTATEVVDRALATIATFNPALNAFTDVTAGVEAVMDFDAQRKGAGVVRTKADQKPLGTIAWNDKGIGTITFADGATETVRVF